MVFGVEVVRVLVEVVFGLRDLVEDVDDRVVEAALRTVRFVAWPACFAFR